MRIVVTQFISLDGVVQAPGGPEEDTDGGFAHGGWSHPFFDDTLGAFFDDALNGADALLFGRRTWQTMAAAWPERAGDDPFADRINSLRKHVVTETLGDDELTWENTTRIPGGEALDRISELRAVGGRDLGLMGSSELVRTLLLPNGLVDELRLLIEPVLLGGGKTIFPDDGALRTFQLVSAQTSGSGVQICVYRPADTA
jgi:dihydrofolate reductase